MQAHKKNKTRQECVSAEIDWCNKVKDIITIYVTASIQQKDNEHALALTEIYSVNERNLQKISQAIATLRKRVDGLAIREGNKGDGSNKKRGDDGNNGDR